MGSMWALCGFVKEEDLEGFLRAFGVLQVGVGVESSFLERCCETLEMRKQFGIVLHLCVIFNGKWLNNILVFYVNLYY